MSLYCSHCGAENAPSLTVCTACKKPIGHCETIPGDVEPSQPQSQLTSIIMGVVCALYLVYPSLGVFELIPDAIPIIGSLDEAAATTGLWIALARLGLNPFSKKS